MVASLAALMLACGMLGGVEKASADPGVYHQRPVEIWHGRKRVDATFPVRVDKNAPLAERSQVARELMAEARSLADRGDVSRAMSLAQSAASLNVPWGTQELSPESLMHELGRRQQWAAIPAHQAGLSWAPAPHPLRTPHGETDSSSAYSGDYAYTAPPRAWAERDASSLGVPPNELPHPIGGAGPAAAEAPPGSFGALQAAFIVEPQRGEPVTAIAPAPTARGLHSVKESAHTADAAQQPRPGKGEIESGSPGSVPVAATTWLLSGFWVGFLMCPLCLVALALVLRKWGAPLGPLLRIEVVAPEMREGWAPRFRAEIPEREYREDRPHAAEAPFAGSDGASEEGFVRRTTVISDEPFPFQVTEMTFDEKQKLEQEQARQTEAAILEHVFHQNLVLREQLREQHDTLLPTDESVSDAESGAPAADAPGGGPPTSAPRRRKE